MNQRSLHLLLLPFILSVVFVCFAPAVYADDCLQRIARGDPYWPSDCVNTPSITLGGLTTIAAALAAAGLAGKGPFKQLARTRVLRVITVYDLERGKTSQLEHCANPNCPGNPNYHAGSITREDVDRGRHRPPPATSWTAPFWILRYFGARLGLWRDVSDYITCPYCGTQQLDPWFRYTHHTPPPPEG